MGSNVRRLTGRDGENIVCGVATPMRSLRVWTCVASLVVVTLGVARAQTPAPSADAAARPPYLDPALPFEARAADLVSRMTLEEKISQLMNDAPAIPRLGVPAYEWWNE